jgi:putative transposase
MTSPHRLEPRSTPPTRALRHRHAVQLGFQFRTRGGARKGAGRPANGERAGVSHLRRPPLSFRHPVHVTLRVARGIQNLRGSALFRTVRNALAKAKERFALRLIHFSVQRDHLHLIVEASDRRALSRGIQGLSIRVARALNHRLHRRGKVFADRYHARALKTPRETGSALRYVLLNARKHESTRASTSAVRDRFRRDLWTHAPPEHGSTAGAARANSASEEGA